MRAVFTIGVLDYFMDAGITFPYGIGVSAGAGHGMSYLSRQRGRAKKTAIDLLEKYKYVGLKHLWQSHAIFNQEIIYDHGMQIYGLAKDQNGKEYFMMKNSWGDYGPYKGFWYVSKPYAAYKTMNIVINKHAIPAAIRTKLGI